MRFVVLTSRPVDARRSGYSLRVAALCAHLPGPAHLVIAHTQSSPADGARLDNDGVFATTDELPPPTGTGRRSWRRHFRISNAHLLELSAPGPFATARRRLQDLVDGYGATHVVAFGGDVAELAASVRGTVTVLDVCDSASLTSDRALRAGQVARRGPRRWAARLAVARKRRTEQGFPRRFALVTAVSDADSAAVEGRSGRVHTVPNGVDESLLGPLPPTGPRRGVAFWGNLSFGPNEDALRFLLVDALPGLTAAGVEVFVAGTDAPPWLRELDRRESGVVLAGYVDDLARAVSPFPVMVNPMLTGSGLKNKVLEAFALGLAVVSTARGVEALPEVRDGIHVARAETAGAFVDTVVDLLERPEHRESLRRAAHDLVNDTYRWGVVGDRWRHLVAGTGRSRDQ